MNFTAVFALTFGILLVFASEKMDGGSLSMLIQPVAFCIVIGGSFCASLLNFNFATLKRAFKSINEVFCFVFTKPLESSVFIFHCGKIDMT